MLLWGFFFSLITSGLSNFTLESERKSQLFLTKPSINLQLIDAKGQSLMLADLAKQQNKILVTEFIYTRCKTLCLTLGDYFQQAQTHIKAQSLQQKIHLLSISFDVAADNPTRLNRYQSRMKMDDQIWSIATMASDADLTMAKRQLGLVVLADRFNEFVHNSAFLVISPQGTLLGIYDDDDIQGALSLAASESLKL
ncbi:MAG: SCO family protein [Methylotenera sp.]|nr:MAG: SCO family protein [Methylotenera sp.]